MKRQSQALATALAAAFLISANVYALPFPQSDKLPPQADINAIGHRNIGQGTNLYSREKEIAIGKALAQEVERSSRLINDPLITDYVDRLCQHLAKNSDARMPITIHVIDSDIAEGFTLPGGFLYINKGLILHSETEAELAAGLAHGIAHTALRSATKLATRENLMQMASIPAMIFTPNGSWIGYDAYANPNLAIPLPFMKEIREDELAADYFGLQYMYKAGYDPDSFPLLIERIAAQSSLNKNLPKAFNLFPSVPDRVRAMRKEIAGFCRIRSKPSSLLSQFEAIKEHIRSLNSASPGEPSRDAKPTLRKRLI